MRKLLALLVVVVASAIAAAPANAVLYGTADEGEHPYVGIVRFFDAEGNFIDGGMGDDLEDALLAVAKWLLPSESSA